MWIHLLTLALISGASAAGDTTPPTSSGDGGDGGYVIKGSKTSDKPWWRKPAPAPTALPRVAQKRARAIVKEAFVTALVAEKTDADIESATKKFATLASQFWRLQSQLLGAGISRERAEAEFRARVVAEFNRTNEESAAIALLLL
jgi:hypothetical protein